MKKELIVCHMTSFFWRESWIMEPDLFVRNFINDNEVAAVTVSRFTDIYKANEAIVLIKKMAKIIQIW